MDGEGEAALLTSEADGGSEGGRQGLRGQGGGDGTAGDDGSIAEQECVGEAGDDFLDVVGDEDE